MSTVVSYARQGRTGVIAVGHPPAEAPAEAPDATA